MGCQSNLNLVTEGFRFVGNIIFILQNKKQALFLKSFSLLLFSVYAYNVSNNFKEAVMWIAFFVGLFLGAMVGATVMALVCASRDFYDQDGEF